MNCLQPDDLNKIKNTISYAFIFSWEFPKPVIESFDLFSFCNCALFEDYLAYCNCRSLKKVPYASTQMLR